ncbi:intercellular adhesion molecule 5 [Taeniopygia guttata]|uniref:intercellular adhesion molecule 5 n=1 Tax=Taeniopygia guttata TaxID=59729 RepID=UPI003BB8FE63
MGPPGPATRLLPPLVLALAGVARGSFTVAAWPRVAVVAFGGSVSVNCSRSACPGGDNATLGLETPVPATPGPAGLRWQSFSLRNVSRWSPGPVTCTGRCGDTEANASTGVLVYQLPERVELEPVAPVAEGDSRTLTCRVLEVAPLRNLTVTLRRGTETLRTESFGDAEGSATVAVSHRLTATRGDHGQRVTCHAELSLRPHGPLFARAAVPVTLSVFALPEPPQLRVPAILEVGTVTAASCRVTGAFPAGDIRVTAALDREPLNVTAEVTGDTVTASTELAPRSPGPRELSCTAAVATAARTARRRLHVYRLPVPALELSPAPVAAGGEVTVTCRSGATEPPAARLQLRDADGGVLAEGPQPRLQLRLVARRDDDGREFRCRASLAVGDTAVTKEAGARLAVLYHPEIPASGCPPTRTWLRGSLAALSCRATGNPEPTVTCGRRGGPAGSTEPRPVTRARAGTYVCNATNALGTRSRRVTVRVEYEPTLAESGCPAHRVWVEGERRELRCRADGEPAPSTRCARHRDTRDGGTRDGGTHESDIHESGTHDSGTHESGTHDGGTHDGGTHHSGVTHNSGTRDGGTHEGDTRDSGTHASDTHHGGTHDSDTHNGGTHEGDTRDSDTHNNDTHDSDTHHGDSHNNDTHNNDTHNGDTHHGDTHVVTRADGGRYVCRATNRHGVAVRSVLVTVEYRPSLGERGCPERRRWLEGSPAELRCAATGNPPPRVTCAKLGGGRDPPDNATEPGDPRDPPRATPNVTRAHAGTYRCRATNAHGSAVRDVTVAVEYGPAGVTVRVLPSANVTRGGGFTVECGAEGLPVPTYSWALPPAPNLRLAADNRSVTVTGATAANRGLYTCTASNRHGRRAGSVVVRVDERRPVVLAALGALGAVAALGLAVAGGLYVKSSAGKTGEYNVRDAEGSSEAARLHRHRDTGTEVFGIQLPQP